MKKSAFLIIALIFLIACGSMKTATVDQLHLGMNRENAEKIIGRSGKMLLASLTEFGNQEVLAYRVGLDIYTLEFMNDQLVRYELQYEDVRYLPPPPPPPVVIVHDAHPTPPAPVAPPPPPRPSPPPSTTPPPVEQKRPQNEGTPRESTQQENSNRAPNPGSAVQLRPGDRERPATTETERPGRRNVDSKSK
jgi:hypothetical protein